MNTLRIDALYIMETRQAITSQHVIDYLWLTVYGRAYLVSIGI